MAQPLANNIMSFLQTTLVNCRSPQQRMEPIVPMACIFLMKAAMRRPGENVINEQDAVRRCQSGDREAFRPIVEYYGDVLMGTLYLMTHNRAVSEELVQETFVRAWKGIATFRLGEPVKPWLVRIAVNQALNVKARRQLSVVNCRSPQQCREPIVSTVTRD